MKNKILLLLLSIICACGITGCGCEHEWKEATCTEPKTCILCDEIEGEALGHEWIDATNTEPKTCSACKETDGEALGYDWKDKTSVASKNNCDASGCYNEGTISYIGISGETEYYCSTHYNEMMDMIEDMEKDVADSYNYDSDDSFDDYYDYDSDYSNDEEGYGYDTSDPFYSANDYDGDGKLTDEEWQGAMEDALEYYSDLLE